MLDKGAKINYVNFIFYLIEGHFQNNSCNKINFTDITFCFQLQKNLPENIFKANIQGNIFINS
jgi:hypothetical protein